MKKLLAAAAFAITLAASCAPAKAAQQEAVSAALADTASTALALSAGLAELNPLGAVGAVAVKVVALAYIDTLPQTQQAHQYSVVSSLWGGAAASNLCWLTGAGPLCFVVGIARGQYLWSRGESERAFWVVCEAERKVDAELKCEWSKE